MAYNAKYIHEMGITLVVLGSLNIILGIAAVTTFGVMGAGGPFHYFSGPIWNGIFVVITGVLGICSGKNATRRCLMVALLIVGIFTIITASCCLSLAIVGALFDCQAKGYDHCTADGKAAAIALHVVNAVLALAEVVMAFTAAIMSCCGLATANSAPLVYNQGQLGQDAYVVTQAGVQCPAASGPGGISQQQGFIAQPPYPTGAPVQG